MRSIVINKLEEAILFYSHIKNSTKDSTLYNHYLSAFINAFRNITFCIQKEGKDEAVIKRYEKKQNEMREDEVLKFFQKIRNYSLKEGTNKITENYWLHIPHMLEFNEQGDCIIITKVKIIVPEYINIKIKSQKIHISRDEIKWYKGDCSIIIWWLPIWLLIDKWLVEPRYHFDEIEEVDLSIRWIFSVSQLCEYALNEMIKIVDEYIKLESIHNKQEE